MSPGMVFEYPGLCLHGKDEGEDDNDNGWQY
jgi:hypothetical protein